MVEEGGLGRLGLVCCGFCSAGSSVWAQDHWFNPTSRELFNRQTHVREVRRKEVFEEGVGNLVEREVVSVVEDPVPKGFFPECYRCYAARTERGVSPVVVSRERVLELEAEVARLKQEIGGVGRGVGGVGRDRGVQASKVS